MQTQRLVSLHSDFSVDGHEHAKWVSGPQGDVVVRIPLARDIPPGAYTIVATILDTFPGLSTDDALLSKRSLSWHYTHSRLLANSSIPEPHHLHHHQLYHHFHLESRLPSKSLAQQVFHGDGVQVEIRAGLASRERVEAVPQDRR